MWPLRHHADHDGFSHMATAAPHRIRHLAGLAGWILLLVAALVVATAFDDPRLTTPAVTNPQLWGQWLAASDPVFVTASVVRLLLVGITWYLLGTTTILLVARLSDSLAMLRVAEALAVPVVRRVVATGLGVGLAASMVAATSGAEGGAGRVRAAGGPISVVAASSDTAPPSMWRTRTSTGSVTAPTMVLLAERPGHAASSPPVAGASEGGPAMRMAPADQYGEEEAANSSSGDDATWMVRSGDHLWHIAAHVVANHLGREPADREIARYWRRLVAHNRWRLPDPGNPDLVLPGFVVELLPPGTTP
jgi:hypothetical protein